VIIIRIKDNRSLLMKKPDDILRDLNESEPAKKYFRSICNWSVEADNINGDSFRINLLRDRDSKPLEKLPSKVSGFTHILTFFVS